MIREKRFGRRMVPAAALLVVLAGLLIFVGCTRKSMTVRKGKIVEMRMDLTLDPPTHTLKAMVDVDWERDGADTMYVLLNRNLELLEVRDDSDGGIITPVKLAEGEDIISPLKRITGSSDTLEHADLYTLYGLPAAEASDLWSCTFTYTGVINDSVEVASFSRWAIADETTGIICEQGAFLTPTTGYYPQLPGEEDPVRFHTAVRVPADWKAIAEGKIVTDPGIKEPERVTMFDSEHPIDGSNVVAGPYEMSSLRQGDVEIAMYYFPGSADLVERYLAASAKYVKKYSDLIGPYAYSRFSVVENWFPTGYGMPSYTLLGSSVLRLPFIIYTSLGHEVCHNWWGNGVFVDYKSGNWCEGLTVYCADYLYKLEQSPEAARQYRMDTDRDYSDYIVRGDERDFPLRDFGERTTPGTRAVGYGKSMMVFHMINQRIGDDAFWESLRNIYSRFAFKKAAWSDFFAEFSHVSGEDLSWFEPQWIDRVGAPSLTLENVHLSGEGASRLLEFDLRQVQDGSPFRLDIPVRIRYRDGTVFDHVLRDMRGSLYHARINVQPDVESVEVDPDIHLFRVLDPRETPPTLSGFFAEESPVIVIPDTPEPMLSAYRAFAEGMNRNGKGEIITAGAVTPELIEGRSVLYLGRRDRIRTGAGGKLTINGEPLSGDDLAVVYVWRNQNFPKRVDMAVWGASPEALAPLSRKLPHYGKYSYLGFSAGDNIVKGHWPVENSPLKFVFAQGTKPL